MINETATSDTPNLVQTIEAALPFASTNGVGYIVAGAVIAFTLLLRRLSSIPLDPREPQLVKTWLPHYGFLAGLYWFRMDYVDMIRPSNRAMAAVQLPGDKAYVAWSPHLIQTIMRSKTMSIEKMSVGFASNVFGLHLGEDRAKSNPDAVAPKVVPQEERHPLDGVLFGPPLFHMNVTALQTVADGFNAIPTGNQGLEVPNFYQWLRRHIATATADGIYGRKNPFREDPTMIATLFEFEGERSTLLFGDTLLKILPTGGSLGSTKSFEAREKILQGMFEYFEAKNYEGDDVSALVKMGTMHFRALGADSRKMARNTLPVVWTATVNTIPIMYWYTTNVLLRPDLIERIRAEFNAVDPDSESPVIKVTRDDSGKRVSAEIDITQLESQIPLLASCYKETLRLTNQNFGTRFINEDTTVTDEDGTSYLLKKGHNVIWSGKTMHKGDVWDNGLDFDPDRFMPERVTGAEAKKRQKSYVPFGGGKHLCPGRHFALAENQGFLAGMLLGYDVTGLKQENVQLGRGKVNDAIVQPTAAGEGGRVTITRRPGWEDVVWSFKC